MRIADQLESLQAGGGLSTVAAEKRQAASPVDGLVVHYFSGSIRCVTCEAIEAQTEATLRAHFQAQLADGELVWKTLNYEDERNADLAEKFEIMMPVVVITQYIDGELRDWKRLDEVWGLVGNESKFSQLIQDNVRQMLERADGRSEIAEMSSEADSVRTIPLPDSNDIPLPNR